MLFKIGLPNPYQMNAEMYFSQMRIAIKAVEKTYQDLTKDSTNEQKQDIWIAYKMPSLERALQEKKTNLEEYNDEFQDIELHLGN